MRFAISKSEWRRLTGNDLVLAVSDNTRNSVDVGSSWDRCVATHRMPRSLLHWEISDENGPTTRTLDCSGSWNSAPDSLEFQRLPLNPKDVFACWWISGLLIFVVVRTNYYDTGFLCGPTVSEVKGSRVTAMLCHLPVNRQRRKTYGNNVYTFRWSFSINVRPRMKGLQYDVNFWWRHRPPSSPYNACCREQHFMSLCLND